MNMNMSMSMSLNGDAQTQNDLLLLQELDPNTNADDVSCHRQEYPPPDPAATATQVQVEVNTALAMSARSGGTKTKKPRTSYNYSTSTQSPMPMNIYQDQIQMMQQKNSFFQGWNENEERSSTSSFTSIPNKCPQMQTMTAFPHQFQTVFLPTPRVHAQPQQQLGLGPWTWSHFHPQPQTHEHEHPDDNLLGAASASLAVPYTSTATLAMQFGNEHYNIMSPRRSNQTPTPLLSKSNMDYLLPAAATEEMMLNGNAEGDKKEDEDIVGHPQSLPLPLYEDRDNGEVATGAVDVKRLGRHSSESSDEHEQKGVYPTNNDHTMMRNHYRAFSPSPSHAQLELDLNLSQIPMSKFHPHPPQQQQQQQQQPQLYEHEHPDPDDNLLPAALAVPHSPVRHPFGNEFYTSPGRSTPTPALPAVYSNSKKDFPLPAVAVAVAAEEMKMKAKQEGGEGGICDGLVFPNLSSIPNLPVSPAGASTNVSIHQNLWDLMFYELVSVCIPCCDIAVGGRAAYDYIYILLHSLYAISICSYINISRLSSSA